MFAIMGVTGKVGGAAALALRDAGQPVRAIVRDAGRAGVWAARGCAVVEADLDDPASLARALSGVEAAFVMLPPVFDPSLGFPEARAMIANLKTALEQARPPKIVALSTIGGEAKQPNLLNQLGLLEDALTTLAMPVTVLRAAWFMDNAALDVASARDEGVIHSVLQPLDRPVPMIAAEDVGRTVAGLLREDWSGTRVVELEHVERVTPLAIAAAFERALGRPVRAEAFARDQWESAFRAAGMKNPLPRMQMIDGFNEGWIDFADRGARARKGATTIDEVVAKLVAG